MNYVSNNDATCTADGTKTAKCDLCGVAEDTVTDEDSKLDHVFTNYVSNNDATSMPLSTARVAKVWRSAWYFTWGSRSTLSKLLK